MTLRLNGDDSGFTEIKAPNAAGDNSITLPTNNGGANQLLQNGGTAGELQYTSAGGGVHYDSSGVLLVGASASRTELGPKLLIERDSGVNNLVLVRNAGGSSQAAAINMSRSRGSSNGDVTPVIDGDDLGFINFTGADGTDLATEAAQIRVKVDGSPGSNIMPGKIILSTNAGGSSLTPRLEVGSNGALKLLSGCPGIDFSAIQTNASGMDSETLDSYEEGTWTPSYGSGVSGGTYSGTSGHYVRIGRYVAVALRIQIIGGTETASFVEIVGLPFSVDTTANAHGGGYFTFTNNFVNSTTNLPTLIFESTITGIRFVSTGTSTTWAGTSGNGINGKDLHIFGSYFTND